MLAAQVSEELKQQVIIENVGGAGGMIGSARASAAAPDGYTVLHAGSAVLAINQSMYKKPLVDGVKDFKTSSMFSDQPRVLVVRKDFPAKTLAEFNAYAKANFGKMQYGSAGAGSGAHVCALLLNIANSVQVTHVPYRGSGPAMQDLIAGRLDYIAEQIATTTSLIESGRIRGIAILGADRSDALPDLPTAKEAGIDGLDCGAWGAYAFPKSTPDAIVEKFAAATNRALESKMVRERFAKLGVAIPAKERRTIAYLNTFLPAEIDRWGKVIKSAGISMDK